MIFKSTTFHLLLGVLCENSTTSNSLKDVCELFQEVGNVMLFPSERIAILQTVKDEYSKNVIKNYSQHDFPEFSQTNKDYKEKLKKDLFIIKESSCNKIVDFLKPRIEAVDFSLQKINLLIDSISKNFCAVSKENKDSGILNSFETHIDDLKNTSGFFLYLELYEKLRNPKTENFIKCHFISNFIADFHQVIFEDTKCLMIQLKLAHNLTQLTNNLNLFEQIPTLSVNERKFDDIERIEIPFLSMIYFHQIHFNDKRVSDISIKPSCFHVRRMLFNIKRFVLFLPNFDYLLENFLQDFMHLMTSKSYEFVEKWVLSDFFFPQIDLESIDRFSGDLSLQDTLTNIDSKLISREKIFYTKINNFIDLQKTSIAMMLKDLKIDPKKLTKLKLEGLFRRLFLERGVIIHILISEYIKDIIISQNSPQKPIIITNSTPHIEIFDCDFFLTKVVRKFIETASALHMKLKAVADNNDSKNFQSHMILLTIQNDTKEILDLCQKIEESISDLHIFMHDISWEMNETLSETIFHTILIFKKFCMSNLIFEGLKLSNRDFFTITAKKIIISTLDQIAHLQYLVNTSFVEKGQNGVSNEFFHKFFNVDYNNSSDLEIFVKTLDESKGTVGFQKILKCIKPEHKSYIKKFYSLNTDDIILKDSKIFRFPVLNSKNVPEVTKEQDQIYNNTRQSINENENSDLYYNPPHESSNSNHGSENRTITQFHKNLLESSFNQPTNQLNENNSKTHFSDLNDNRELKKNVEPTEVKEMQFKTIQENETNPDSSISNSTTLVEVYQNRSQEPLKADDPSCSNKTTTSSDQMQLPENGTYRPERYEDSSLSFDTDSTSTISNSASPSGLTYVMKKLEQIHPFFLFLIFVFFARLTVSIYKFFVKK